MKKNTLHLAKPKYKIVFIVVLVLLVLTTISSVIFGINLPKVSIIDEVGTKLEEEETKVETLVDTKDGKEYFVSTNTYISRYDSKSNKVLETLDYKKAITEFVDEKSISLSSNSLISTYFICVPSSEADYLLAIDTKIGNIFKFVDSNGSLSLVDDYYISDTNLSYLEYAVENDDLYLFFSDENARMIVGKYNLLNLGKGAEKTRYIWNIDSLSGNICKLTLSTKNIKIWDISISGDYIYLSLSFGIIRLNKDFNDYENINFYSAVEEVYENSLRNDIKNADEGVKEELGLNDELVDSYTLSDLEKIYKKAVGVKLSEGRKTAENLIKDTFDWCEEYDISYGTLSVKKDVCSFEKYSISRYGGDNPLGVTFINDTFYLAGNSTLYSLKVEDLYKTINYFDSEYIENYRTIVPIDLGEKSFNTTYSITKNKNANTIYLMYANSDLLSILDVSETPSIISTFTAGFNVQKICGDENNDVCHFLAISAATENLSVYSVGVKEQEHASTIKTLFIVSLVLAILSLIVFIFVVLGNKNTKFHSELKVIKKDLKKNKFVYLALIPFIVLLFMFCYYEAIGSISYSFFDYTQLKPTFNWNNFNNYTKILTDPAFLSTVENMLIFLVADIVLAIIPPFLFAFALSVMDGKKYSKTLRTIMFIPGIIPGVATMLIWKIGIYGDTGILNQIASLFGASEPIQFLTDQSIAKWALLLMGFPFVGSYLIFFGGLMNIPKEYYEYAELEGISVFKRLILIDIPLTMPQLKYVFIITFINSVQNYPRTYMLDSTARTPVHNLYLAMESGDYGVSSAYATLIFIFLFVAIVSDFRMQKKEYMGDSL